MPELRIGTSGWVYPHWKGMFYPPKLHSQEWLSFYALHFTSVEVNCSYYRLPPRRVFERWRRQTPPHFLFSVKGSRYLTHLKKLKEPREPLARLMECAGGLEDRLGPVLFQLPHTWPLNLKRLESFLEALAAYPAQRFAFEFRHRSWLAPPVFQLLERTGAALCLPVGWGLPVEARLTARWSYVRMHGGQRGPGFDEDELRHWATLIAHFLAQGADIYISFNNDVEGHAVRDASRLAGMLSAHGRAGSTVPPPASSRG